MLDINRKPNFCSQYGKTPIDFAHGTGCMDELRCNGANGWTPLMVGSLRRDVKRIQDALQDEASVNATNKVLVMDISDVSAVGVVSLSLQSAAM